MIGRLLRLALLLVVVLLGVLIYRLLFPSEVAPTVARSPATSAPLSSLPSFDPATDPQLQAIERHAARASFVGDYARTTVLRVAMTECYYSQGEWPNDGCGVLLEDLRGQLLQTARIEPEGVIVLDFAAGKGLPEIEVQLTPSVDSVGVRWQCSSPNYEQIDTLLHDCEYRPN